MYLLSSCEETASVLFTLLCCINPLQILVVFRSLNVTRQSARELIESVDVQDGPFKIVLCQDSITLWVVLLY